MKTVTYQKILLHCIYYESYYKRIHFNIYSWTIMCLQSKVFLKQCNMSLMKYILTARRAENGRSELASEALSVGRQRARVKNKAQINRVQPT